MFATYCAVCHGPAGKGDGPAAAALKMPPPNLTLLSAKENGTFPEGRVARTLSGMSEISAHGSPEMPIWGELFKSLGQNDPSTVRLRIVNITDYVKSLQTK
jgi:mono/diheme cytochrome c family protein